MTQQGLGQVGQPQEEQFTVETAVTKNAEAIGAARGVGRPKGLTGLGTPPAQPSQVPDYSQSALEAVVNGQVDPMRVLQDPNVNEQAKTTIRQSMQQPV